MTRKLVMAIVSIASVALLGPVGARADLVAPDIELTEGDQVNHAGDFVATVNRWTEIRLQSEDGDARAGSDYYGINYTQSCSGGLLGCDTTEIRYPVWLIGDTVDEPNEAFTIWVRAECRATFCDSSWTRYATAKIIDDDPSASQPPDTTITSGPQDATNDPTPTFAFSSSDAGSSFQCRLDAGAYASCTSPKTIAHLADGSHSFYVRATKNGFTDPSPASRTFTVNTAEVKVSGSTLVVTAATGARDNFAITRPSASILWVTDLPSDAYTGSGVHTGAGCIRSGDYTANCNASGITLIQVFAGDQIDKVVNSTGVKSSLDGGAASDVLTGGSGNDTLNGRSGADTFKGMNGNDLLLARDIFSDRTINCDGGTSPGGTDQAELDGLPRDPDSSVIGCEAKIRH